MEKRSLNIVVFPWLAFGHMLPFLDLSKALAIRGHRVTYISTLKNIQRLPKIPSHLSPLIQFVSFSLPQVENLDLDAESTADVPPEKVELLKVAFDGLQKPFSLFLQSVCSESRKPDWIIMDFSHHWVPKIAQEYFIPCTLFLVFPAYFFVFFGPPSEDDNQSRKTLKDFTVPPSWIPFPSNLAFRLHEARWVTFAFVKNASGISDSGRTMSCILESKFVCIRSSFPLESKWLSLLAELYEKPVVPVGLLPSNLPNETLSERTVTSEVDLIDWLDQHDPKSVLYVALGSEATLTPEQHHKLALGLEMSKVHFLWALKVPSGTTVDNTSILPERFLERIRGFGLVVTSWVPQIRVLSHESVGGFLTHCGRSSTIEGLQFGLPLIMLPMSLDQGLTSRVLMEEKLGVEIPRNEDVGSFKREDVIDLIREISLNYIFSFF